MSQLPLALKLQPHASLESFVAGGNQAAVEHLQAVAVGERPESLWLWGPNKVGKSHLLAAACRAASDAGLRPIYFALDSDGDPAMLGELQDMDLIALDDLDLVAGNTAWEAALFSVFNARLHRGGLVIAASSAPREIGLSLPDLESRAGAAAVYRLDYLEDNELKAALMGHAASRGLSLESAEASYLLQRFSRDMGDLTACLDRIDRYSLAAQRRITIPLLREFIEDEAAASSP